MRVFNLAPRMNQGNCSGLTMVAKRAVKGKVKKQVILKAGSGKAPQKRGTKSGKRVGKGDEEGHEGVSELSALSRSKIREQHKRARVGTTNSFKVTTTKINQMEEANAQRSDAKLMDENLETSELVKQSFRGLKEKKEKLRDTLLENSKRLDNTVDKMLKKADREAEETDCKAFAEGFEARLRELVAGR